LEIPGLEARRCTSLLELAKSVHHTTEWSQPLMSLAALPPAP
jgi:hypothetical protein